MMNHEMFLIEDLKLAQKKPMRDGFGEELVKIAGKNERVVALTGDLRDSMRLDLLVKEYPEKYIECGIAEENMMGIAAGLALSGKIPFATSLGVFNPGRNWDQLRISVCLSNANVKVVGGHGGFGNGGDGANQQPMEDVGSVRVLPNLMIVAPCDYEQIKKALMAIVEYNGPVYLRMTKPSRAIVTTTQTPFELGKAQIFRKGRDVTVIASGALVYEALLAAEMLEKEIDVEVINIHTIKPIDREAIIKSVAKTRMVVTAEEHQVIGGLGSAVAEVILEAEELQLGKPVLMQRVGMDGFGESGGVDELMTKYGLSADGIVKKIKELTKVNGK